MTVNLRFGALVAGEEVYREREVMREMRHSFCFHSPDSLDSLDFDLDMHKELMNKRFLPPMGGEKLPSIRSILRLTRQSDSFVRSSFLFFPNQIAQIRVNHHERSRITS